MARKSSFRCSGRGRYSLGIVSREMKVGRIGDPISEWLARHNLVFYLELLSDQFRSFTTI